MILISPLPCLNPARADDRRAKLSAFELGAICGLEFVQGVGQKLAKTWRLSQAHRTRLKGLAQHPDGVFAAVAGQGHEFNKDLDSVTESALQNR